MVPLEALNIPRDPALLWKQIYRTIIQSQVIEILEDLLCYWFISGDRLLMGEQACAIHIFFQSVYRRLWKSVSWLLWEITFLTILGKEELLPSWELHKEFLLSHPQPPAEFFRRSYQGLKSECPCVTPPGPGGSSPELEPICMCFTPALFFLTSLPHSVDRRQLPQSMWGTIWDNRVLGDLPRVALSSSSQGKGCAVPPDAGGALG